MRAIKQSRSRRILLIAAVAVGGVVSATLYFSITMYLHRTTHQIATVQVSPKKSGGSPTAVSKTYGLPVRLKIPKLGVDTAILYMGLTSTGDMEVPADLKNVGWYKYGPHPGDSGSAVIAGHLEGYKDKGVFIALDTLVPGDIVTVVDDAGVSRNFAVRESHSYDQHDRPSKIFNTNDKLAHLNLITCTGIWHESEKRYSQRLVVFTDRIK